eukprot:9457717-Alexandrium_andersonii.AAC.1
MFRIGSVGFDRSVVTPCPLCSKAWLVASIQRRHPPGSSGGSGGRQPLGKAQETSRMPCYPFVATLQFGI